MQSQVVSVLLDQAHIEQELGFPAVDGQFGSGEPGEGSRSYLLDQSSRVQVLSGLYSVMAEARFAVSGPRSFW
jgi:hypothetical protein